MKVAVIGNGNVGLAVFRELQRLREVNEIVLAGRNIEKINAEILDFEDARVISPSPTTSKLLGGGYKDTEGADIIIYAAGVGRKPGQSRLELTQENVKVAREIFGEIKKYNNHAIIIVISNPVDILTAAIRQETGFDRHHVIGTGTLLDTARLASIISSLLDISPYAVYALMVGEHGNSSCVVWSAVRILGMPLKDYFALEVGNETALQEEKLAELVRDAGGKIIKAKGYTAYGVAAAAAKVTEGIINNSHNIFPLSICLEGEYGLNDVSLSVPCILGREGIIRVVEMKMTDEERAAFYKSADILKEAVSSI